MSNYKPSSTPTLTSVSVDEYLEEDGGWQFKPPGKTGVNLKEEVEDEDGRLIDKIYPVMEHFNIKTRWAGKRAVEMYFPYPKGIKVRDLTEEDKNEAFFAVGKINRHDIFGWEDLQSSSPKQPVVIVEGEMDVAAAWGLFSYDTDLSLTPVFIGVPAAATTKHALAKWKGEILKHDQVYLAFDSGPGEQRLPHEEKNVRRGKEATEIAYRLLCAPNIKVIDWYEAAKAQGLLEDENVQKVDPRDYVMAWYRANEGRTGTPKQKLQAWWDLKDHAHEFKSDELKAREDYEELLHPVETKGIIPSFFTDTFEKIGGLCTGGSLGVLAGPQGTGKTEVSLRISVELAGNGVKHAAFWLENISADVRKRWIAAFLQVPYSQEFKANPLSIVSEEQFKMAYDTMEEYVLMVTAEQNMGQLTIKRIEDMLTEMTVNQGIKMFIFDNLTYIMNDGGSRTEKEGLDAAIAAFKRATLHLKVDCLLLNQLKQEVMQVNRRQKAFFLPIPSNSLRGSQMLTNTANYVISLEPEIMPDGDVGRVRMNLLKNRDYGTRGVGTPHTLDSTTGKYVMDQGQAVEMWDLDLEEDE